MKYLVVIEKAERNYSAYVPDLPGCVAVGDSLEEVKRSIQEAVDFHVEGMMLHGETVAEPTTQHGFVELQPGEIQKKVRKKARSSARP